MKTATVAMMAGVVAACIGVLAATWFRSTTTTGSSFDTAATPDDERPDSQVSPTVRSTPRVVTSSVRAAPIRVEHPPRVAGTNVPVLSSAAIQRAVATARRLARHANSTTDPGRDLDEEWTRHGLDTDGIREAVRSMLPAIAQCYDGWLAVGEPIRGSLRVEVRVETDPADPTRGIVTQAELLDTEVEHAALEGCVLNALSELLFEPPDSEFVEFHYPIAFEPG